jgi:hypothetical protein
VLEKLAEIIIYLVIESVHWTCCIIHFFNGFKGRSPLKSSPQGIPCERETQFRNKFIIYLTKIVK